MVDVNYLQEVKEGEKIKASVTNSNNNYLDNKIDTSNKNFTEVLNGIKTSLQSQIETNNTNLSNSIDTLKTSLENAAVVNGNSIKFDNGILINWGSVGGMGNNSNNNISWSTPFVGGYCVGGSANYSQWRGDKGSTWAVTNMRSSFISIRSAFEENGGHVIWVIAIGRWK
nr:MAG TPA: hypothetical protein [Caudoviricetes sp.]